MTTLTGPRDRRKDSLGPLAIQHDAIADATLLGFTRMVFPAAKVVESPIRRFALPRFRAISLKASMTGVMTFSRGGKDRGNRRSRSGRIVRPNFGKSSGP